jgi:hypothetical protein
LISDLTSRAIIASAHPVSFTIKTVLAGCEYVGIWPFSRNAFSDESCKAASVYVVGVMNLLFQEYGLTT